MISTKKFCCIQITFVIRVILYFRYFVLVNSSFIGIRKNKKVETLSLICGMHLGKIHLIIIIKYFL